jgi:drug/metabolite transporter (DMT)-like permease
MLPIVWFALFADGIPAVNPKFWGVMALMLPFEIAVNLLFFRAIKNSELSLVFPFTAFLPLFVSFFAFLILDEKLSPRLVFAVLLIALGAYLMRLEKFTVRDFFTPFKRLAGDKGISLVLIVTLIWGFLAPLGKLATSYSSARFFPAVYFTLATILFTPIFLKKSENGFSSIWRNFGGFVLVGLFYAGFLLCNWAAYSMQKAGLVNAVGALAGVFTVILAGTFFKESSFKRRIIAALIMFLGVLLIKLWV